MLRRIIYNYKLCEKIDPINYPWRWKCQKDIINIMNRIKIYEDVNDFIFVVKTPSFMEKIILMNKIGMTWHYEFIYYNEYLFDSNYHTI